MTKRALILAGGGIRVAWQAGVVQALEEAGLRFDHGDGTSGGIFTLAALLSGISPAELAERWRSLNVLRFASTLPLRAYLRSPTDWPAFGGSDGIRRHVLPHLGVDLDRVRAATASGSGMTGTFNVADFSTKRCVAIPHDEIDMPRLLAGVSLAVLMPAVEARGRMWTDAVWIQDANPLEAVRRGCTELWVLWCIANTPRWGNGPLEQYVHMIELSANSALFADLDRIAEINRRRRAGEEVLGSTQPVTVHLVKPALPLPLDPDFLLGRIDAETLVAKGYRDASRYLAAAGPDGIPLDDTATRMSDPPLGARMVLRGTGEVGGDLGAEPATPARLARPVRLCLVVEADDLAAFRRDPAAGTPLVGGLDHPDFGYRPFSDGVLRLADGPGGRRLEGSARLRIHGVEHRLTVEAELSAGVAGFPSARGLRWALLPTDAGTAGVHASGDAVVSGRQALRALLSFEPSGAHDLASRAHALSLAVKLARGWAPP